MKRAMIAAAMGSCLFLAACQPVGMGPGIDGWTMMAPWGMGPGMMAGGYGLLTLSLTDAQREKLAGIEREAGREQWELMARMHDHWVRMRELFAADTRDDEALRKTYDAMADIQKEMFEASLQARKRIDEVLTPEQRQQMHRGWGWY